MPFLNQFRFLSGKVLLHLLLGVELIGEQLVVLLVGLLHVGSDFFLVSFFECLDSLVVLFKLFKLLFEFLTPVFKTFLNLEDLGLHLLTFQAMRLF